MDEAAGSAGFGMAAMLIGGAALLGAVVTVMGGPFAPQSETAVTVGEFAAQAGKAALRDVLGLEQPAELPRGWDVDRVLWVSMAALGALAVFLSVVSLVRREPWRWAAGGAALGIGAITFQFAMAVVAAILLILLVGTILGALGLG